MQDRYSSCVENIIRQRKNKMKLKANQSPSHDSHHWYMQPMLLILCPHCLHYGITPVICSLSVWCGMPSARSPECQPGWTSSASQKSLRSFGTRSQMKLWTATRVAGRRAWRFILISGGHTKILKHHFRTPKMCSITFCADVCWRLNSSNSLTGLEYSLLENKKLSDIGTYQMAAWPHSAKW